MRGSVLVPAVSVEEQRKAMAVWPSSHRGTWLLSISSTAHCNAAVELQRHPAAGWHLACALHGAPSDRRGPELPTNSTAAANVPPAPASLSLSFPNCSQHRFSKFTACLLCWFMCSWMAASSNDSFVDCTYSEQNSGAYAAPGHSYPRTTSQPEVYFTEVSILLILF